MADNDFKIKKGLDVVDGKFTVSDAQVKVDTREVYPLTDGFDDTTVNDSFPVGQSFFKSNIDGVPGTIIAYRDAIDDNNTTQIFIGSAEGTSYVKGRVYNLPYEFWPVNTDWSMFDDGTTIDIMEDLTRANDGYKNSPYWFMVDEWEGPQGEGWMQKDTDGTLIPVEPRTGAHWLQSSADYIIYADYYTDYANPYGNQYTGDFDVVQEIIDFTDPTPPAANDPNHGGALDYNGEGISMAGVGIDAADYNYPQGRLDDMFCGMVIRENGDMQWAFIADTDYITYTPEVDTFVPRTHTTGKARITREDSGTGELFKAYYSVETDPVTGQDIWVLITSVEVPYGTDSFEQDEIGPRCGFSENGFVRFGRLKFFAPRIWSDRVRQYENFDDYTQYTTSSHYIQGGWSAWKDLTTDTLYANPFVHEKDVTFKKTLTVEGSEDVLGNLTVGGNTTITGTLNIDNIASTINVEGISINNAVTTTTTRGIGFPTGVFGVLDKFSINDSRHIVYDLTAQEVDDYNNPTTLIETLKLSVSFDPYNNTAYFVPYNRWASSSVTGNLVGGYLTSFDAEYDSFTQTVSVKATSNSTRRVVLTGMKSEFTYADTALPPTIELARDIATGQSNPVSWYLYYTQDPGVAINTYRYDGSGCNPCKNSYNVGTQYGTTFYLYNDTGSGITEGRVLLDPLRHDYVWRLQSYNSELTRMKGLENLVNLTHLYAFNNKLTELDLSANSQMQYINIENNPNLTTFTRNTNNQNLQQLYASNCNIGGEFVLQQDYNLTNLQMGNNNLDWFSTNGISFNNGSVSLDVSGNPLYQGVYVAGGEIGYLGLGATEYNQKDTQWGYWNGTNPDSWYFDFFQNLNNNNLYGFRLGGTQYTNIDFTVTTDEFRTEINGGCSVQLEYESALTTVKLSTDISSFQAIHCPVLTTVDLSAISTPSGIWLEDVGIIDETAFVDMTKLGRASGQGYTVGDFLFIENIGVGYQVGEVLTVQDGIANNATITVDIVQFGGIQGYTLSNAGTGLSDGEWTYPLTGSATGQNATLSVIVIGGTIVEHGINDSAESFAVIEVLTVGGKGDLETFQIAYGGYGWSDFTYQLAQLFSGSGNGARFDFTDSNANGIIETGELVLNPNGEGINEWWILRTDSIVELDLSAQSSWQLNLVSCNNFTGPLTPPNNIQTFRLVQNQGGYVPDFSTGWDTLERIDMYDCTINTPFALPPNGKVYYLYLGTASDWDGGEGYISGNTGVVGTGMATIDVSTQQYFGSLYLYGCTDTTDIIWDGGEATYYCYINNSGITSFDTGDSAAFYVLQISDCPDLTSFTFTNWSIANQWQDPQIYNNPNLATVNFIGTNEFSYLYLQNNAITTIDFTNVTVTGAVYLEWQTSDLNVTNLPLGSYSLYMSYCRNMTSFAPTRGADGGTLYFIQMYGSDSLASVDFTNMATANVGGYYISNSLGMDYFNDANYQFALISSNECSLNNCVFNPSSTLTLGGEYYSYRFEYNTIDPTTTFNMSNLRIGYTIQFYGNQGGSYDLSDITYSGNPWSLQFSYNRNGATLVAPYSKFGYYTYYQDNNGAFTTLDLNPATVTDITYTNQVYVSSNQGMETFNMTGFTFGGTLYPNQYSIQSNPDVTNIFVSSLTHGPYWNVSYNGSLNGIPAEGVLESVDFLNMNNTSNVNTNKAVNIEYNYFNPNVVGTYAKISNWDNGIYNSCYPSMRFNYGMDEAIMENINGYRYLYLDYNYDTTDFTITNCTTSYSTARVYLSNNQSMVNLTLAGVHAYYLYMDNLPSGINYTTSWGGGNVTGLYYITSYNSSWTTADCDALIAKIAEAQAYTGVVNGQVYMNSTGQGVPTYNTAMSQLVSAGWTIYYDGGSYT